MLAEVLGLVLRVPRRAARGFATYQRGAGRLRALVGRASGCAGSRWLPGEV